ncbi:MAG: hypothetical protein ACLRPB_10230 [Lawsonibacter sp.]
MSTPKSARETPGSPVLNKKNGGKDMEIKNLDELRAAYPDLLAQAENAAQAKGVASERARIQGIEDIEAAIGDAEMVKNAKYGEKPMNAEQLAFAAMKKQAAVGMSMLAKLDEDTKNSGSGGVKPTPASGVEPKDMTDDDKAEALLLGCINKKEGK